MSASALPLRRSRYYFWIGALALCLLALGLYTGVRVHAAIPKPASFWWSVTTGATLVGCIAYQWALFFARVAGRHQAARSHYRRHRYVGTATVYLFLLHAGGIGYALLTVLPLVFLAISVTGLLNSEIIPLKRLWMRRCWGTIHIGLSGLLVPLIAFHAWAALAFK